MLKSEIVEGSGTRRKMAVPGLVAARAILPAVYLVYGCEGLILSTRRLWDSGVQCANPGCQIWDLGEF